MLVLGSLFAAIAIGVFGCVRGCPRCMFDSRERDIRFFCLLCEVLGFYFFYTGGLDFMSDRESSVPAPNVRHELEQRRTLVLPTMADTVFVAAAVLAAHRDLKKLALKTEKLLPNRLKARKLV